jgi:hypothetical protein
MSRLWRSELCPDAVAAPGHRNGHRHRRARAVSALVTVGVDVHKPAATGEDSRTSDHGPTGKAAAVLMDDPPRGSMG